MYKDQHRSRITYSVVCRVIIVFNIVKVIGVKRVLYGNIIRYYRVGVREEKIERVGVIEKVLGRQKLGEDITQVGKTRIVVREGQGLNDQKVIGVQ